MMIVFFLQGSALVVFPPTILDIADSLGVSLAILSAMFASRAAGSAFGAVGAGFTLDMLPRWSYLFMTFVFLSSIASKILSYNSLCVHYSY